MIKITSISHKKIFDYHFKLRGSKAIRVSQTLWLNDQELVKVLKSLNAWHSDIWQSDVCRSTTAKQSRRAVEIAILTLLHVRKAESLSEFKRLCKMYVYQLDAK